MATVNLDYIQFWAPPSKPLFHKQHTALPRNTNKYTTGSQKRSVVLYKADRISKHNNQPTSIIISTQYRENNSIIRAQYKTRTNTRKEHI
jgi:hypothetical protein